MNEFDHEQVKKKKIKKEPLYIILCIFCLVLGSIGGYFYRGFHISKEQLQAKSLYDEISEVISRDFVDLAESDVSLQDRMLWGMVKGLGDPHSSYLSLQQARDLTDSINGSFQGIGVSFLNIEGGALIIDVFQNSPAMQAGLQKGDLITHVEGTSIAGYDAVKIKQSLQGKEGEVVSLRLLRNGKTHNVKCSRAHVESSVEYEVRKVNKKPVGYIRLTTFGENSHQYFEEALKSLTSQGVEDLVIDLRDNGGGYLEAAKDILDLFIDEGEVLIRVENKNGDEEVHKASQRDKYHFEHGYVLVNGKSASASEVMTGALKELLDYQIVGSQTYGKGTVQMQYTLSDSSVLKYTKARWLTPSGKSINGIGFTPDVKVNAQTIEDFYGGELEKDYRYDDVHKQIAMMQKALHYLEYPVDRQDGYFSKQTQTALKTFEKDYHLKQNGVFEKADSSILMSAVAYRMYQVKPDVVFEKVKTILK